MFNQEHMYHFYAAVQALCFDSMTFLLFFREFAVGYVFHYNICPFFFKVRELFGKCVWANTYIKTLLNCLTISCFFIAFKKYLIRKSFLQFPDTIQIQRILKLFFEHLESIINQPAKLTQFFL